MGAGQEFDRLGVRAVAGHRPVVLPVQAHDLGEHMRVPGIALRAGGRVPLPVPGDLHRVDREHYVPGREQRLHPRAAVGLNTDHHPPRRLLRRQVRPLLRQMLGDQRMQPRQPLQPLRKPRPSQPAAGIIDQLHIVMLLGPVISDEQHPPSPLDRLTANSGEQAPAI